MTAAFTPSPEHGGYGTIVHGGVTSTLLDEAMVWASYALLDQLAMTTELHVRFLGPVRCGDRLEVRGAVIHSDGQGADARAELRDSTGTIRADATARLRFVSPRAAERMSQQRA